MNDDFWSIPVDRDSSRNRARLLLSQRAEKRALEAEREGLVKVQLPALGVMLGTLTMGMYAEQRMLRTLLASGTPKPLRTALLANALWTYARVGHVMGVQKHRKKVETEEQRRTREESEIPPYTKVSAATSAVNLAAVAAAGYHQGGVSGALRYAVPQALMVAVSLGWLRPRTPVFNRTNNRLKDISEQLKAA